MHNILIGLNDLLYLLDKLRECAPFVIYGYVKGVFCNSDMNLKNEKFERDPLPIEPGCTCPACQNYSRAYIRHLFKAKEMLAMRLCVLHNLNFYNRLTANIRKAIEGGCYKQFKEEKLKAYSQRV